MASAFYTITVSHFLVLAAALFCVGVVGVLARRNALIVMMSIELMLNAGNLTLLAFARQHGEVAGMQAHAFAFVVVAVAAAEAAVGLAIVVAVFRSRRTVSIEELTALKH